MFVRQVKYILGGVLKSDYKNGFYGQFRQNPNDDG